MSLLTDLVSFWELEEVSGTRFDSHGTNDLTDNDTVGSTAGVIGNAALFRAAQFEWLSHADNADLSMGAAVQFSFRLFFHPTSGSASAPFLFAKDNGSTSEFYLRWMGGGDNRMLFHVWDASGSGYDFFTTETFSSGTTYHLVITYDGAELKIYVDGNAPTTASFTADVRDSTGPLDIGYNSSVGSPWDGFIDEFGIWKRGLTGTEVSDLYASGAGLPYASFGGGGGGATDDLSGTGSGVAGGSGALTVTKHLSGTAAGAAAGAGFLSVTKTLSGTGAGAAGGRGFLTVTASSGEDDPPDDPPADPVASGLALTLRSRACDARGVTKIGGRQVVVLGSITRPADTTAYDAGDVMADSASAPTVASVTAGRLAGLGGVLTHAVLLSNGNETAVDIDVFLFSAAPAAGNDNEAFAPSDAELLHLVAVLQFKAADTVSVNASAGADGNQVWVCGNLGGGNGRGGKAFKCAAAETRLFWMPVARGAYAPEANEVFTLALGVTQD